MRRLSVQDRYSERIKAIYLRLKNPNFNLYSFLGKAEWEYIAEIVIRKCIDNIMKGVGPFCYKEDIYIINGKIDESLKRYHSFMKNLYLIESMKDDKIIIYPNHELLCLLEDYFARFYEDRTNYDLTDIDYKKYGTIHISSSM